MLLLKDMSNQFYGVSQTDQVHSPAVENKIPTMDLARFWRDYDSGVRYGLDKSGYIIEKTTPTPESIALIEAVSVTPAIDESAANFGL